MKKGYTVVYFLERRQRVYADRTSLRVDMQARLIKQTSREPAKFSESSS